MTKERTADWDPLRLIGRRLEAGEEVQLDLKDRDYLKSVTDGLGFSESSLLSADREGRLHEWTLEAYRRMVSHTKRVTEAMVTYCDSPDLELREAARELLEEIASSDPVKVCRDSAEYTLRPR